jgi:transposase InsO family protein
MTVAQASDMQGVSRATGFKWLRRFKEAGAAGLEERGSKPRSSPRAFPRALRDEICAWRHTSGRGPLQIAWHFQVSCSAVHKVLYQEGISRLKWMDRATREVVRYEHERPGDLLHLDVKKLWRVPPGGGRFAELTREGGESISRVGKRGWGYELVHVAIDDFSRWLYVEILPDQTAETTVAFLGRAVAHFAALGVTVRRVLTDNGANYRSKLVRRFARRRRIVLKHTRPYRPQTNGKAERVIQTLLREWVYQRLYSSNEERTAQLLTFLKEYNLYRPHTALGRRPPITRIRQ